MSRVIRLFGILPLLLLSGPSSPRPEVPEAEQIPNWPAPPYWTQSGKAPGGPRANAVNAVTAASARLPFVALPPCRIVDTRGNGAPIQGGMFTGGADVRSYDLSGICGLPTGIGAVSLNFTATGPTAPGFLTAWPTGGAAPPVSILNFTEGQTVANAAIVPTSTSGSITVNVSAPTHVIVDVNGYYDGSGALQLSLSRRAVLNQFWTPQNDMALGLTAVGSDPHLIACDGADIWVSGFGTGTVSRVRASDGRLLETWTGAAGAFNVLAAAGKLFVIGPSTTNLYRIDPSQPVGAVTTVTSSLGSNPSGITFDGSRIWTANDGNSVSIVTPGASMPWSVTTITTGFMQPFGVLYDGANIWVTDIAAGTLLKLSSNGAILQTVAVGSLPRFPIFDGTNIWVPNQSPASVSVVQASTGTVVATLTGNGLNSPLAAAFDGQRILVTNSGGDSVSLWRAADLLALGSFPTGTLTAPEGVCSDGLNFWITLRLSSKLARF